MAEALPNLGSNEEMTEFNCDICFELYDDSGRLPKFLMCHHTFCSQCLQVSRQHNKAHFQDNIQVLNHHYISQQVYANSGEISCPNKCPEITKVPSKNASDLKNNFYLFPKVQERVAKEKMKKLTEMVAEAKENRSEDLEMSRQSLALLKTIQTFLGTLAAEIDRLVKDRILAVDTIQTIMDKPTHSEVNLASMDEYETELRVSYLCKLLIILSSSFYNNVSIL